MTSIKLHLYKAKEIEAKMTNLKLHMYNTKEIHKLSLDYPKVALVQDQRDKEAMPCPV